MNNRAIPFTSTSIPHSLDKNQPIGIYDSGIGGLTVASAISKIMPRESIIYYGDTAHHPYGDKSADSVRRYSKAISKFLESKGCKVILIACNTASARSYAGLSKEFGTRLIFADVIDPVARHIAEHYRDIKVGVIATKGTINSRIYPRRIKKINPNARVSTLATPLLAPMIEEGFFNNTISRTVINAYLSKHVLSDIDALVLGCTHYPLIRHEIELYYGSRIPIIDSAEYTARHLLSELNTKNLLSDSTNPRNEFFVSDYTEAFSKSTKIFFGEEIHLKKLDIW